MIRKRYYTLATILLFIFVVVLVRAYLLLGYTGSKTSIPTAAAIINQDIPVLGLPFILVLMFAIGLVALILTILRLKSNKKKLSSIREKAISQREFLENIIKRMPIGIGVVDVVADDLCIYLNEKYTLYSGLDPEKLYGKHLSNDKIFQKIKNEVLQKKAPRSIEGIDLWKGTLPGRYLRFTSTPIYNENGDCIFIISDIIDLTNVHMNKMEAVESLSRLRAFVTQNVASIGFFLPVYENGVFTGVTIEETNAAHKSMFSTLNMKVGDHITPETPGCEWLMEAFSALHTETKKPYNFKNLYIDAIDRYIFGYAFWCSENPAYISTYITDKSEEIRLHSAEVQALEDLAKNIVALATLNDKIRNPLSIIVSVMEIFPLSHEEQLLSIVQIMDSFIDRLDLGFCESTALYHAIEKQNNEEKTL